MPGTSASVTRQSSLDYSQVTQIIVHIWRRFSRLAKTLENGKSGTGYISNIEPKGGFKT